MGEQGPSSDDVNRRIRDLEEQFPKGEAGDDMEPAPQERIDELIGRIRDLMRDMPTVGVIQTEEFKVPQGPDSPWGVVMHILIENGNHIFIDTIEPKLDPLTGRFTKGMEEREFSSLVLESGRMVFVDKNLNEASKRDIEALIGYMTNPERITPED